MELDSARSITGRHRGLAFAMTVDLVGRSLGAPGRPST